MEISCCYLFYLLQTVLFHNDLIKLHCCNKNMNNCYKDSIKNDAVSAIGPDRNSGSGCSGTGSGGIWLVSVSVRYQ